MGRLKAPFYRLVVVDSRSRRDSDYIENLGIYNPLPAEYQLELNGDRAIHWLEQGAQMSETARSLMRQEGILLRWHLQKQGVDAATIETQVSAFRGKRETAVSARLDRRSGEREARLKAEADAAAKAKRQAETAAAEASQQALSDAVVESSGAAETSEP
jgi:small subunit ribosomal protein S16